MSPASGSTRPGFNGSERELRCTTALCESPAAAYVSWPAQPQALPFCRTCADLLASHGDTVVPLSAGPAHRVA